MGSKLVICGPLPRVEVTSPPAPAPAPEPETPPAPPPRHPIAAEKPRVDNFCGIGYRITTDGCEPIGAKKP